MRDFGALRFGLSRLGSFFGTFVTLRAGRYLNLGDFLWTGKSCFRVGKKTHKHKQICGIVPGLGGWQHFVYVFFRVIPYGGEKTHKQNSPPEILDNPVRFLCVFVFIWFFFFFFRSHRVRALVQAPLRVWDAFYKDIVFLRPQNRSRQKIYH